MCGCSDALPKGLNPWFRARIAMVSSSSNDVHALCNSPECRSCGCGVAASAPEPAGTGGSGRVGCDAAGRIQAREVAVGQHGKFPCRVIPQRPSRKRAFLVAIVMAPNHTKVQPTASLRCLHLLTLCTAAHIDAGQPGQSMLTAHCRHPKLVKQQTACPFVIKVVERTLLWLCNSGA